MNSNSFIVQKDEHGNIQSSIEYFLGFNIPKDAKILDVGCRYGSLIFNLYKLGYTNVHGIDVLPNSIERGKTAYPEIANNINLYEGNDIPYPENTFDVITMLDVIEHIPNVQEFLKNKVHRGLKSGGKFIFQTPNKIINIPWEIINNKSLTKWKTYHCSLQTPVSLRKVLTKSGFSNVTIEKGNILTQHNKSKVRKKIGSVGIPILHISQKLPLFIYPNMWGSCEK